MGYAKVLSGFYAGRFFYSQRVLHNSTPPNKACSGRVGVCGIFKHFSGFGLFLHLKPFPTPPTRR
jgi:hypothetical protein